MLKKRTSGSERQQAPSPHPRRRCRAAVSAHPRLRARAPRGRPRASKKRTKAKRRASVESSEPLRRWSRRFVGGALYPTNPRSRAWRHVWRTHIVGSETESECKIGDPRRLAAALFTHLTQRPTQSEVKATEITAANDGSRRRRTSEMRHPSNEQTCSTPVARAKRAARPVSPRAKPQRRRSRPGTRCKNCIP